MSSEKYDVLVVGGGPAGLRAAELVSAAGWRTALADQKPSVGRKFLVAGRGGLNLTHSEPVENFPMRYGDASGRWEKLLRDFSPTDLRAWAKELGVETFIGTSGRVFPVKKQAAPLLRRWVERLKRQGVEFRMRHALGNFWRSGKGDWNCVFFAPEGSITIQSRAVILAFGGSSWPQTGSDGKWERWLTAQGIKISRLEPANCGFEVDWAPQFLALAEGLPLKNIVARATDLSVAGELLITKYGLEGGALYQLGPALRSMEEPGVVVDFKPAFTAEQLIAKMSGTASGDLLERATKAWRLSRAVVALLQVHAKFGSVPELAAQVKAFSIPLTGPRPIDEAISTAGGVSWDELNDDLMLKRFPGIFCAGEMIDWEAPTGGYLLQGCFSTATRAARGALKFRRGQSC